MMELRQEITSVWRGPGSGSEPDEVRTNRSKEAGVRRYFSPNAGAIVSHGEKKLCDEATQ